MWHAISMCAWVSASSDVSVWWVVYWLCGWWRVVLDAKVCTSFISAILLCVLVFCIFVRWKVTTYRHITPNDDDTTYCRSVGAWRRHTAHYYIRQRLGTYGLEKVTRWSRCIKHQWRTYIRKSYSYIDLCAVIVLVYVRQCVWVQWRNNMYGACRCSSDGYICTVRACECSDHNMYDACRCSSDGCIREARVSAMTGICVRCVWVQVYMYVRCVWWVRRGIWAECVRASKCATRSVATPFQQRWRKYTTSTIYIIRRRLHTVEERWHSEAASGERMKNAEWRTYNRIKRYSYILTVRSYCAIAYIRWMWVQVFIMYGACERVQ